MSKTLTSRLPDSVVDEVHRMAEAEQLSVSEVVRRALVTYFGCDPSSERHRTTLYETVKTRAFLFQFMELQLGEDKTEQALDLAEETAREYVEKRLGKEKP